MMLDVKSFQLQSFLPLPYEEVLAPRLKRAHEKLQSGSGAGGEFTGWVHLPRDYDREEFARIQAAASRIRANSQALVVIGIGGSYLGARGVINIRTMQFHFRVFRIIAALCKLCTASDRFLMATAFTLPYV